MIDFFRNHRHSMFSIKKMLLLWRHFFVFLFISSAVLCMSGCGGRSADDEITSYVVEIKKRPALPIEPLPEFVLPAVVSYDAENLRDPFVPEPAEREASSGVIPDAKRSPEPLEAYPLDALKMVGLLEQDAKLWVLMATPDGSVMKLGVNNYLGQNYGKVVAIDGKGIDIVELVKEQNVWVERPTRLILEEAG